MSLSSPSQHPNNRSDRQPGIELSNLPLHSVPHEGPPAGPQRAVSCGIQDEERNRIKIAASALGQPEGASQAYFYAGKFSYTLTRVMYIQHSIQYGLMLFFFSLTKGDQTGLTSTLDLCSAGHRLPQHFLIPTHMPASLADEDRLYLGNKGVFTLPGKEACESLIRAYFRHVHPIMPIVEAGQLLYALQSGRLQDYNILLIWSVFFVAVNVLIRLKNLSMLGVYKDHHSLFRCLFVEMRATSLGRQ